MFNIKLNYYSHILLTSKYSFIIKLVVFFSIYLLFYADNINDLAFCAKKKASSITTSTTPTLAEAKTSTRIRPVGDIFELERMKVHEKIVAYTNMEPEDLIRSINRLKSKEAKELGESFRALSTPLNEKKYIQEIMPPIHKHTMFEGRYGGHSVDIAPIPDEIGARKVYYLLRMYRRLIGI